MFSHCLALPRFVSDEYMRIPSDSCWIVFALLKYADLV